MNLKRGVMLLVVLAIFLSLTIADPSDLGTPQFPGITYTDVHGLKYTLAVGIGNVHDDNGCDPNSGTDVIKFGILSQTPTNNFLTVYYPVHENGGSGPAANVNIHCSWKNLPLNERGCYFFSSENDGGDYYFGGNTPDDCSGWFAPDGAVIDSQPLSANTRFFGAVTESTPVVTSATNALSTLIGYPSTYHDGLTGQPESSNDYSLTPGENSICLFSSWSFSSLDKTFRCMKDQGQYRWYICDDDSLYETTGKYLQKPQCNLNTDCQAGYTCNENICTNPQGIIQDQTDASAWVCTKDDQNHFAWTEQPLTCNDINCEQDKNVCASNNNAWVEMNDGQSCCGNDGVEDIGKIGVSKDGSGERLCLKADSTVVGSAETDLQTSSLWTANNCVGEWCWIPAIGEAKFHILTINKPGEPSHDILSNNNHWTACNENVVDISQNLVDTGDIQAANRFNCHQEGARWSWADCTDPDDLTAAPINGAKQRGRGDGPFALLPTTITSTSITGSAQSYQSFYGTQRFDISGYSSLEFMVKFTSDIVLPAGLKVTVYGPENQVYFTRNVLADATNNPLLAKDAWVHIKVPISDYYGVAGVRIDSIPEANQIKVKNIFLSNENAPKLCSGETSRESGNSAWIQDLDTWQSGNPVSGEKICKDYFGDNAWLGGAATSGNRRCCGNDPHEYYAGASDNSYGCWNSQPIASGETTMNVELRVQYQESSTTISYPVIPVEYTFTYQFPEFEAANTLNGTVAMTQSPKQLKVIEGNFSPTMSGDHKWGRIRADSISAGVDGTTIIDVPSRFDQFVSAVDRQEAIRELQVQETGYSHEIDGTTATFETSDGTNFWITWIFAKDDFSTPLRVSHNDNLGIALASNCNAVRINNEGPYNFDASRCHFSTEPAETVVDQGGERHPSSHNNGRYVYWQDNLNDAAAVLHFHKGWNVLFFVFDNDGGSGHHFNYHPAFPTDGLIENNPHIIYMDSRKPTTIYPTGIKVESHSLNSDFTVQLYDIQAGIYSEQFIDLQGHQKFAVMATTNRAEVTPSPPQSQQKILSYSCPSQECLYPLPGEPPYTITNPHPELYELWFVTTGDDGRISEQRITLATNTFTAAGNIKVKKIAQQVLFVNTLQTENEQNPEATFYGCQTASSIVGPAVSGIFNNQGYCGTKAGKFCSPSITYTPSTDPRERYTTINSWSTERITQVGYTAINTLTGSLDNFYQNTALQLRSTGTDQFGHLLPFLPEERNHTSSTVPGRNSISNAGFISSGTELPHWEIFSSGILLENEHSATQRGIVTLTPTQELHSERLAIPPDTTFHYTDNSSCPANVFLVDKDGMRRRAVLPEFNSAHADYLQIQYHGPCSVSQPFLQIVDELGAATYSSQFTGLVDDSRSGVACCPQNYCWSGYSCVEPMSPFSYLAEHISSGRDYRCISGEWKYLPPKFDWSGQQWGFCEQQDQCFVLSSTLGGQSSATAKSFLQNQFPTCINNGEYILDHYCDQGNWTSRTKFIANKLLDIAGDQYTLYCAPYQDALINYNNLGDKAYLLGGNNLVQVQQTLGLGQAMNNQPASQQRTCFDLHAPQLVPDKENTCVNNVCILVKNDGKTALATTLNINASDEQANSFFLALNIPQDRIKHLCEGSGEFIHCDLSGLNIGGDLWYSPTLNAVVYGRQGISLTSGVWQRIVDFFQGFFSQRQESSQQQFLHAAQNFRELYLLAQDQKKITAIKEILGNSQNLISEYQHFNTPLCDYVQHLQSPAQPELLQIASGNDLLCRAANGTQKVQLTQDLNFFWPQLTSQLRVS